MQVGKLYRLTSREIFWRRLSKTGSKLTTLPGGTILLYLGARRSGLGSEEYDTWLGTNGSFYEKMQRKNTVRLMELVAKAVVVREKQR